MPATASVAPVRRRPGPRRGSPARPAARAGLVAGRAGDQRHHGRGGPAAPRVPRRRRRGGDGGRGPVDPPPSSARRHLGQLPRRPGRPVHDRRGLRRAAAGRAIPRTHRTWPAPRPGSPRSGGIPATRVFTRIWLALFGQWSWDDLPVMPPELIYLPAWFPLNVYDWACWARQTIVPLTIVGSLPPGPAPPVWPERVAGGSRCRSGPPRPASRTRSGADRLGSRVRRPGPGAARVRSGTAAGPAGPGGAPGRAAPLRGVDHRAAGEGRLLGRHPAAVGLLADRAAPARLRPRPPGDRGAAWPAWTGSRSGRTRRTARCAGWRRASHRCGTRSWR